MSIFGDIEDLAAGLYPYRWPITIGLIVATVALLAFAYRRGWHRLVWRHKAISGVVAAILIPVAILGGNYLLSPLWERSTVCEASPKASGGAGSEKCAGRSAIAATSEPTPSTTQAPTSGSQATPSTAPSFEAHVTRQGQFQGKDSFHFGRGTALLIETAPDTYTVRFEEFSVRNGPDLFVFLSPTEDGTRDGALKLGALKGTDGAFNYDVPAGVDVSQYKSVIVWCEPFSVLFASAPLR